MSSGHYCDDCAKAYYNCACKIVVESTPINRMEEILVQIQQLAQEYDDLNDEIKAEMKEEEEDGTT